jgi:Thrombospondin type 1 domain.
MLYKTFLYNVTVTCLDVGKIYTEWSSWSPCNEGCKKNRQRFCSNYNKIKCPTANQFGIEEDEKQCSQQECYSKAFLYKKFHNYYNRRENVVNSLSIHSSYIEPVNGHWGRWTFWEECSNDEKKQCGNGTRGRTRLCNDPSPKHNGQNCPGKSSQTEDCFIKPCSLGKYIWL